MPKTLTLYVIAHTQTHFNERHIFAGWKDSRLTKKGEREARALGEKLRAKNIGMAFVSPLVRARATAMYVMKHHPQADIFLDRRLMERDYGSLSGKSKDKFAREHPDKWPAYHRSYDVPPPGGESIKDLEKRVLPCLREIVARMKKEGRNAIIVAHSNTLRPIRRHFEKLTPAEMMKLEGMYNQIYTYRV